MHALEDYIEDTVMLHYNKNKSVIITYLWDFYNVHVIAFCTVSLILIENNGSIVKE